MMILIQSVITTPFDIITEVTVIVPELGLIHTFRTHDKQLIINDMNNIVDNDNEIDPNELESEEDDFLIERLMMSELPCI